MWLVDLPGNVEAGVIGVVLALLTLAIQFIASYLPWLAAFLEQYKQEWGMALAALLIGVLEANLPGGEWADASILGVLFVTTILLVVLGRNVLRSFEVRGFK